MTSRATYHSYEVEAGSPQLAAEIYRAGIRTQRKSRAKRNLAWEQIEVQSHGFYANNLHDLASRFPILTPMELRICVLIKGMLANREIAECLNICVETVENHRVNIRHKLGLRSKQNLVNYLLTVS